MPPPPPDVFLDAVLSTVRANAHYVPPRGKGSLYLRPLLLGTGPILGLGPAPSYSLVVYAAAVGAYFKVGTPSQNLGQPALVCLCGNSQTAALG